MSDSRRLKLRRSDACVVCETALAAGTVAYWNAEAKNVTCLDCLEAAATKEDDVETVEAMVEPGAPALDRGTAGASARRRYEHLHSRRERRVRDRYGRLGGIYLALTDEPQSTVAWAQGSRGEGLLGGFLEKIHHERRVVVLHDRLIPGT